MSAPVQEAIEAGSSVFPHREPCFTKALMDVMCPEPCPKDELFAIAGAVRKGEGVSVGL